jgi:hypothetical protein
MECFDDAGKFRQAALLLECIDINRYTSMSQAVDSAMNIAGEANKSLRGIHTRPRIGGGYVHSIIHSFVHCVLELLSARQCVRLGD